MRKLKKITFLLSIFIITAAFNFQHNPPSGWYQQFLPNINGRSISDMTFLDSLTGFLVTPYVASDSSYILKTTNGGDNWNIVLRGPSNTIGGFNNIKFLNLNIGYACGNFLWKTTNAGINWFNINTSGIFPEHMHVLNQDTIWIIDSESLTGGVFRTTNGGVNWVRQASFGSSNPEKIYMFNARIGFISCNSDRYVKKTTDGGASWNQIVTNDYFMNIYFSDSLIGWKNSAFGMKKTTNGGLNWVTQTMPSGGIINNAFIYTFSNVNKDTIWGSGGGVVYPNTQYRGLLLRTTNGGDNWYAQVPDTSIHLGGYSFIKFINKRNGWVYSNVSSGIHTTVGGDTSFLTSVRQISSEIPKHFKLDQNYPNPFNPNTIINYQLTINSFVTLKVFDLQGKEVQTLVNKKQSASSYSVEFNAANLSSGIYFYTLQTENYKETKKMMLVK